MLSCKIILLYTRTVQDPTRHNPLTYAGWRVGSQSLIASLLLVVRPGAPSSVLALLVQRKNNSAGLKLSGGRVKGTQPWPNLETTKCGRRGQVCEGQSHSGRILSSNVFLFLIFRKLSLECSTILETPFIRWDTCCNVEVGNLHREWWDTRNVLVHKSSHLEVHLLSLCISTATACSSTPVYRVDILSYMCGFSRPGGLCGSHFYVFFGFCSTLTKNIPAKFEQLIPSLILVSFATLPLWVWGYIYIYIIYI